MLSQEFYLELSIQYLYYSENLMKLEFYYCFYIDLYYACVGPNIRIQPKLVLELFCRWYFVIVVSSYFPCCRLFCIQIVETSVLSLLLYYYFFIAYYVIAILHIVKARSYLLWLNKKCHFQLIVVTFCCFIIFRSLYMKFIIIVVFCHLGKFFIFPF